MTPPMREGLGSLLGLKADADSSLPAKTISTDVHSSPPFRRPDGRATGTARFQEVQEIALGDADAVHHSHVPQFAASTERVNRDCAQPQPIRHFASAKIGTDGRGRAGPYPLGLHH